MSLIIHLIIGYLYKLIQSLFLSNVFKTGLVMILFSLTYFRIFNFV